MEERDKLISFLNDPVFKKAWRNAELMKPSVFPSNPEHHEGKNGDKRAARVLARIQGWELHKAALIKQSLEIIPRKKANSEEYPASGSLESEIKKHLPVKTT